MPIAGKMSRRVAAKISRGRAPLAVADQILISGSNFLTSIVLVRGLGLTEFGKYSAAYIFLLYANALQMSFIAFPMLSLAPLMAEKEKKLFVKGMFTMQLIASGLLCVVFAAGGLIFRLFSSMYTVPIILAFGLTVGVFQAQELAATYRVKSARKDRFDVRGGLFDIFRDHSCGFAFNTAGELKK